MSSSRLSSTGAAAELLARTASSTSARQLLRCREQGNHALANDPGSDQFSKHSSRGGRECTTSYERGWMQLQGA